MDLARNNWEMFPRNFSTRNPLEMLIGHFLGVVDNFHYENVSHIERCLKLTFCSDRYFIILDDELLDRQMLQRCYARSILGEMQNLI